MLNLKMLKILVILFIIKLYARINIKLIKLCNKMLCEETNLPNTMQTNLKQLLKILCQL